MTYAKFRNLMRCAGKIGIQTVGELDAYKKRKGINSNEDLYFSLLEEAAQIS